MDFEVFERRSVRKAKEGAFVTVYRDGTIRPNDAAREIVGKDTKFVVFLTSKNPLALAVQATGDGKPGTAYRMGDVLSSASAMESIGASVKAATRFRGVRRVINGDPALVIFFKDGERKRSSDILNNKLAREIRERAAVDKTLTHSDLAEPYGVTRECVRLVLIGRSFPDAGGPIERPGERAGGRSAGAAIRLARRTEESLRRAAARERERQEKRSPVIAAYLSGKTQEECAVLFGVKQSTVSTWLRQAGVSRGKGKGAVTERQRAWGHELVKLRRERREQAV